MRKNDRFEQELNVAGAARRAKAFGIKTMTVVVTAAMLVSGVPTRVIAEGLQEAGVIATQDSTDQSASSSGQQAADQSETQSQEPATDQSNTQEQSQAASEQAAQPSSQDNAATAQNDSPSAQPAQSAQPSQQTATADIALMLNNASITYKGQVVAQPAQKVTAPTSDSFQFTVQPDNGYKLSKVTLTVSGTDRELKADANGLYTVDAADVAQSPRITLQTEQEKTTEPAREATPIEDAEGVEGEANDVASNDVAAAANEKNVSVASDVSGEPGQTINAKVGNTVTLNGTSNRGDWLLFNWIDCGYRHEWELIRGNENDVIITRNGNNATVLFRSVGTYTIEHKYCKKKHRKNYDHKTDEETFTVEVSDKGVENAYFYFVRPGSLPSSNKAADWYPAAGAETQANMGSINITDMKTDGSTAGNSYDNVANRVVSWPEGLGTPSADGLVLSRSSGYWDTLFEAYKEETGITNKDDVKDIILHPYKISKPGSYHLDCTVEIVAKSTVTADFYVWYPGDTGYTNVDTHIYPLNGDSVSVPVTTQTLKETEEYNGVTYKLYSWYDNPSISGKPVSFPATASSNVKYYAKYVAQDQTVTVKYVDKETGKLLDSETLTNLEKGQRVTKSPKVIKGYEVDKDSKNPITAIAGTDSEIVFYYNAKKGTAGYYLSVSGATWSDGKPSDLVSPWDGNNLKYKYNYGFAKGDTFNVTSAVPVASGKVFIGWLDKARDEQPSAIRHAGDQITYIYSGSQTYCLDALWASLSATGENVTYDGKPHGVKVDAAINDGSNLLDEYKQQAKEHVTLDSVEYKYGDKDWTATAPSFVDAGEYPVYVRANVTVDGDTKQLTAETTVKIAKRVLTLKSADLSKQYDGTPLTNGGAKLETESGFAEGEGATYDFTGSQTVVGSSANAFSYTLKPNTKAGNYKITKAEGTLTVTNREAKYKIAVKAKSNTATYNGEPHSAKGLKQDEFTVEGNKYTVSGLTTEDPTKTDAGTYTNNITGTAVVKDAEGNDVTGQFEVTTENGSLVIGKAPVTIKSADLSKQYDGTPLTNGGAKLETESGFAEGEGATYDFTGSQTVVGSSANAFSYTLKPNTKAGNYKITKAEGTLTVTNREAKYKIAVKAKSNTATYNGEPHSAKGLKQDEFTVEGNKYTVSGLTTEDPTKTDAGTYTNNITGTAVVKDAEGNDVTGQFEVTTENGSLVIGKAPVTVTTEGASKTYDGEALTHDVATIEGLKNNETATIHATGSQTEVGESDNGYAITWDGSAQKDNYTIKTETIGKLVVSETADQITATPVNVETTYDGEAHGTTVQVTGLPKGYSVKKAESKATATDVADGEVKATVDELVIVNAQGKDVTSKLNIKRGTATIKITPAPLTVTTDGGEKEYDGKALTASGIKVEGLKGKDSVSAKTTGSRTKVGSSNNTYEISWRDTKKSNYKVTDVLGKLKVTPSTKAVTLTSGSASHVYSGHALTSDEIEAEGLPEGFTVEAKMDGAQTDAGSSKNTVKSYKILDAKGDDVTDMFANVTVKPGTLTVSPKEITVETEGATKVYDGQELTNKNGAIHGLVSGERADVVTNGTQTNVGSSDNGYTIAWGTAKEGNYTIASDTLGKLIVTPQSVNPNDPSYRKLQVNSPADLTYDGQTHKWVPEVKDFNGNALNEGVDYTLAYDTDDFTNTGVITVTVAGKGNYTGTVSRTYCIKPAPVSIKTESAARVYNGKALTAGGAITGLVNGETVDFRVTGSQTKVGHSANTYKLAWTGTARETNYTIDSIETGTLTVTESEDTVVVTTTGGTFTYDGKAHGATVAVSQPPEGYTVDGTPSSDATATDVNGDGVKATVDHLVIRNAEGEDVTSKLNIKKIDGTIKVLPAELTVTTDSATKVYDGTALTAGATVTGLVGDEEATLEATGEQTQVGSSSNGYKLTFDKTAKAKNYKVVSENLGTLTVTKQSIVPSEPGTPSDNYKGVTVDDPKDVVYDGVEHKWTPVVKDADGKKLVEGAEYVVTNDTDDFIDVATINVTITGKGNYTGTIVKSYRITKAPLHVVTGSATKVYDGKALTSETVTIDGLAKRDRIGIAVTGSQTNVGSSQNTYTIDWMQTSADNYELTDELGTLTVAAAPARPSTPTTPATPTTPTVPNPTPNSSDGGSTTTTAAPTGEDSATGNDQEQKEEKIIDAKNPLGKFDGKKDTCWVHWYMIICAVATAAYGLFVGLRRDKHSRRLQNDLDKVLGNDDETQE